MSARTTVITLLAAASMWLWGCVTDSQPEPPVSLVCVGDRLPHFTATTSDGLTVSDSSFAGRSWILTFITTSCPDCRRALPELQSFHQSHPATPVVCIARSQSQTDVEAYWTLQSLTLPVAADPEAAVYHLFATAGVPRVYVIGPQGTVVAAFDDTSIPTADRLATII